MRDPSLRKACVQDDTDSDTLRRAVRPRAVEKYNRTAVRGGEALLLTVSDCRLNFTSSPHSSA
jgi:hypothetical protein